MSWKVKRVAGLIIIVYYTAAHNRNLKSPQIWEGAGGAVERE